MVVGRGRCGTGEVGGGGGEGGGGGGVGRREDRPPVHCTLYVRQE